MSIGLEHRVTITRPEGLDIGIRSASGDELPTSHKLLLVELCLGCFGSATRDQGKSQYRDGRNTEHVTPIHSVPPCLSSQRTARARAAGKSRQVAKLRVC